MTVGRRFFVLRAKSHPHPPAAVAAAPAADARALHHDTAVPADAAVANRPHQADPTDPPTIDDAAAATPADPDPASRKKRRALRFPKLSVRRPSKPPPATRDHPDPGLDEPPPTPAVPPSGLTEALGDGIDDVALVLAAALHEDPSAMDIDATSTSDDDAAFWDPPSDAAAAAAAANDLTPTAAAAAGRPRRATAPPVPLSVATRNLATPLTGTPTTSAVTTVPPTLVVTAPPPPGRHIDGPVEAAAVPVAHAHRPPRLLAAWVHVMTTLALAAWQYVQAYRWLRHPALVDAVQRTRGDPDQINWLSPLTYVALLTYPIPEAVGGGKDRAVGGAAEDAPSGGGAVGPAARGPTQRGSKRQPQQATERRAKFSTLRDTHIVQQRRRNVLALTLYTLTMRWVSADAFIVLMLASQALLLYFMKNSRRINLQMAKTNLKNRVGWAKQWAGGLFRRHAPQPPPPSPSRTPATQQPPATDADDLDLDFDDQDESSGPGPDDDDENHLADTEDDPVPPRARGGARRESSTSPATTPRIRRRMPLPFRRNTPPPPAPAGPSLAVVAAATQNRRITLFRRSQSTPVSPAAQHAALPPLPLPYDPPHPHPHPPPPAPSLHAVSSSVPASTISVETSRATHATGAESDTGCGTASLAASPPPSSSSRLSVASLVRAPSSNALAARTLLAPVPEAGCDADAAPAAEPDAVPRDSSDIPVAVVDDSAAPGLVVTRPPVVLPSDSSYYSLGDGSGNAAARNSADAPRHEGGDDHGASELVVPPVTSGLGRAASTRRQSAKAAVVTKARDLWSHVKGGSGHHGAHAGTGAEA
ncbi:hypothetical protein GGF31_003203 [Allomyces arbusculus]|nr:hypothetical protein GGF31_003203 [Allomyces arbusculus]